MMEGYQDTDLGIIPNDWKITELSDIAKCTVGIATSTTHAYSETGVLLLRNQNIKEGKITLSDVLYINSEFDELNKSKRLKENDIITVRTGYPGVSAVVTKELEGAQSFTTLIIRLNEQNPLSNFLCYYINSEKGKTFFTNNQAGGGQQNVGAKTLERMKIPLPPVPEQQKIAEILSTVDAKIDVIDQQITETHALKKGLMQRLLTKGIGHTEFKDSALGEIPKSWEVRPIGKISTVVRGASPRPQGDPRYYGGNVPRLMGKDVSRDGKYVTPKIDFLTDEGAKKSRFMPKGTLVMICSGDVGVPSILAVDACVHDGFLAFPDLSDNCDINYLFYIFDSLHQKFNSSATHGGIFTNLTTTIIKEFLIPIPSFSEQQKISEILSSVDDKLNVLSLKKTHFQELKQGLMQQLLTGKIRVL